MDLDNDKMNKDILNRLRRIEGQVKGVHGMLSNNACCDDVLIQLSAIRSAINKVGALVIEHHATNCLSIDENSEDYEAVKKLIKNINTFVK